MNETSLSLFIKLMHSIQQLLEVKNPKNVEKLYNILILNEFESFANSINTIDLKQMQFAQSLGRYLVENFKTEYLPKIQDSKRYQTRNANIKPSDDDFYEKFKRDNDFKICHADRIEVAYNFSKFQDPKQNTPDPKIPQISQNSTFCFEESNHFNLSNLNKPEHAKMINLIHNFWQSKNYKNLEQIFKILFFDINANFSVQNLPPSLKPKNILKKHQSTQTFVQNVCTQTKNFDAVDEALTVKFDRLQSLTKNLKSYKRKKLENRGLVKTNKFDRGDMGFEPVVVHSIENGSNLKINDYHGGRKWKNLSPKTVKEPPKWPQEITVLESTTISSLDSNNKIVKINTRSNELAPSESAKNSKRSKSPESEPKKVKKFKPNVTTSKIIISESSSDTDSYSQEYTPVLKKSSKKNQNHNKNYKEIVKLQRKYKKFENLPGYDLRTFDNARVVARLIKGYLDCGDNIDMIIFTLSEYLPDNANYLKIRDKLKNIVVNYRNYGVKSHQFLTVNQEDKSLHFDTTFKKGRKVQVKDIKSEFYKLMKEDNSDRESVQELNAQSSDLEIEC